MAQSPRRVHCEYNTQVWRVYCEHRLIFKAAIVGSLHEKWVAVMADLWIEFVKSEANLAYLPLERAVPRAVVDRGHEGAPLSPDAQCVPRSAEVGVRK